MSVFELFESNLKSRTDLVVEVGSGSVHNTNAPFLRMDSPTSALRQVQFLIKRLLDIVVSLFALIALAPLFLFVAFLIRLDSRGPVLFSQNRWGKDGKLIRIYKFRSMRIENCDFSGVTQTTEQDPRVAVMGNILRRTNIDELPQLFNILKGDMSLIGPRCHVPGMLAAGVLYEELVPEYHLRHQVRPGLTGLAQVRGLRGPTVRADKARARVMADLYYIENYSLWLDFKIGIGTVLAELRNGSGF